MAKKLANRARQSGPEVLDNDQRWAVIDADSKRSIYLESMAGIDRQEAERLSATLRIATEVVPRQALDSRGRYDPSLMPEPADDDSN